MIFQLQKSPSFISQFASLNATYRYACFWVGTVIAGMILGSALIGVDAFIFFILFIPGALIALIALIALGATSSWQLRTMGNHAIGPALAPFAAMAASALAFIAIWSVRGVPPLVSAGTNEFHIEQVLAAPDSNLRAVILTNLSGGPATGESTEVYIERRETSFFQYRDLVFSKECAQDLVVQWAGPSVLKITYSSGYYGSRDDGSYRPPFWVLHAGAKRFKVVVVRRMLQQRSLC